MTPKSIVWSSARQVHRRRIGFAVAAGIAPGVDLGRRARRLGADVIDARLEIGEQIVPGPVGEDASLMKSLFSFVRYTAIPGIPGSPES